MLQRVTTVALVDYRIVRTNGSTGRQRKAGLAGEPNAKTTEEVEMLVASVGWLLGSILFFFIWVAIALWPARVAARKGHSFF
jgi:hypothetical protein